MEIEPIEIREHRYLAQKELSQLLKDDSQAERRQALEEEIVRYQEEICPHAHTQEFEGVWRCKDCDLHRTTAAPEPESEREAEATPAEMAGPAEVPSQEAPPTEAAAEDPT